MEHVAQIVRFTSNVVIVAIQCTTIILSLLAILKYLEDKNGIKRKD